MNTSNDILPKTAAVVVCRRIGLFVDGYPLRVALGDTHRLYAPESDICTGCGNNDFCADALKGHADRDDALEIVEVICPQAGSTAIELSVAQETWAGLENPDCRHCSHKKQCLPMAI